MTWDSARREDASVAIEKVNLIAFSPSIGATFDRLSF
jgi:hypothetical protein